MSGELQNYVDQQKGDQRVFKIFERLDFFCFGVFEDFKCQHQRNGDQKKNS